MGQRDQLSRSSEESASNCQRWYDTFRQSRTTLEENNCHSVSKRFFSFKKCEFRNWFHLTIEYQWRTILSIFFAGFLGSWIVFAIIYHSITWYYRLEEVSPSLKKQKMAKL